MPIDFSIFSFWNFPPFLPFDIVFNFYDAQEHFMKFFYEELASSS